ncbi:MAG: NAD(P)/FAD-dependent oxidoreductase [Candidatus Promineifilaceae bacterium]|nr:NAD(P)/FAD-dependent oxidoreductase [Candidatus Promineifilaceae bacterium]
MSADRYDVIIIGAGHNGLVAAAYLAKAGRQVLVLEARDLVGGAAASEEVWPGFQVEIGAVDAGLLRPRIASDLKLEQYGLYWVEGQTAVFAPQPDGTPLRLWRDVTRTAEALAARDAALGEQWPRFVAATGRRALLLGGTMLLTPPDADHHGPMDLLSWLPLLMKVRRQGRDEMMELVRVLPLPVRDYLDEWFGEDTASGRAVRGVLAAAAAAGDVPGPYAAGTTYSLLYHQSGGLNGGFRSSRFVRGGLAALLAALREAASGQGAEIRTGSPVVRILLDEFDEEVVGVRLDDGQEIQARAVLSSADPKRTFFELIGAPRLPPSLVRAAGNVRQGGLASRVALALDGLPAFVGAEGEADLDGHIVIAPSVDYVERAWDAAKYGRLPVEPVLEAVVPTIHSPELAPNGQQLMLVTARFTPYRLREGEWAQQRERLGDLVAETLAQYAPDLPSRILKRRIITPADYAERYMLTDGGGYHGQMALDQLFFMRPIPGYGRYRTPIAGLYLGGAGTHPGGGITGAPGYNAAKALLSDRR